jgi:hypothetical protein
MKTTCTYCNKLANTKDHIPPKGLFPKPRPSSLITVPTCSSCNNSYSKDDEYLRDVLSFREELSDNPFITQLNKAIPRRFDPSRSEGYFKYIHGRMGEESVKTKSGIYLGVKTTFYEDLSRIQRVLERVTKGLYRHCTGNKLAEGFDALVYTQEYFLSLEQEPEKNFRYIFQNSLADQEWVTVVPSGFDYKFKALANPGYTLWMLRFYLKYYGFAVTLKEAEKEQQKGNKPVTYRPCIMTE